MASDNGFRIVRKNVPRSLRKDLYHDLLSMSWKRTLIYFSIFFILLNSLFATLYWLEPGSLHNSDNQWLTCFFFSVQTLGTIGYGFLAPATLMANILVTIEAVLGLISMAIMTGLFFAKFSRTFAKVEFTENMVVTHWEGKKTLIFRMINLRENRIIDSTVSVTFLRKEKTQQGTDFRRFYDLKLVRSKIPMLSMSINIMHVIDEDSPLFGMSDDSYIACEGEIIVALIGTDSTFGQTIHSTYTYQAKDIRWNKQFKDMVFVHPDGTREVDYANFNQLV